MNREDQSIRPYPPVLNLRLVGHDEMARYDALMAGHHRRGALRRIGHGPENMACLRRFALTLLRYRQQTRNQPITEQIARLALNPGRVLEYLRLTGNTRPRNQAPPPYLIAA